MSRFFIESKTNFHPDWKINDVWSSGNGYETKEEAEIWLQRARLHAMSCVQATSFSFRIANQESVKSC